MAASLLYIMHTLDYYSLLLLSGLLELLCMLDTSIVIIVISDIRAIWVIRVIMHA
jgi:hypothetical protein